MGIRGTGISYANGGVWTAPYATDGQTQKPFTILTWVRDTTASGTMNGYYGGMGNPAGSSFMALQTSGNTAYADEIDSGGGEYYAGVALATAPGAWVPIVGVYAASNSRAIYTPNGATASDSAVDGVAQNFSLISLGGFVASGGSYLECPTGTVMAEFAIWKAALGPQEVALLQAGVSPLRVRPESLLCYFPLRSDLQDRGPLGLRLSGPAPVFGEHPPVAQPDVLSITRSLPMLKTSTPPLSATLASSTAASALSAAARVYTPAALNLKAVGASTYSTTRSTPASYFDAAGVFRLAAPFEPRPAFSGGVQTGYLSEPAATNLVPTTADSSLCQFFNTGGGVSIALSGSGVENGLPYSDFTISGTNTTGGVLDVYVSTVTTTSVPASSGQTYTASVFPKVVSAPTPPSKYSQCITSHDSSGNFVEIPGLATLDPSAVAGALGTYRPTVTATLAAANDAYVLSSLQIEVNTGASVNCVLRIAAPQIELGSLATSFIPTYGTPATRTADSPAPNAQSTVSNNTATATLTQAGAAATLAAASAVGVRATLASAQSASLSAAASSATPAALTASASPAALASSASVAVQGSLSRSAASSVAATASNPVSGSVSQAASPASLAAAASAAQVVLGLSAPATPATLSAAASTTVLGTVSAASAATLSASAAVAVSAALSQAPAPASLSATSNAAQVAGSLSVSPSPAVLSAAALAQQPSAALARTVSSSPSATATATQPSAALSKAEAPATLSAAALATQPSAALSRAVSATLSASAGVAVAGSLSAPVAATFSAASAVDVAGVLAASSTAASSATAFAVQPSGTVALSLSSVPDSLAADVQVSGYVYQVVFDAVSAFADDPVVGGLGAALDDADLSSVATAHQPRAALSRTQGSTLAAHAELVTLGRVSLTTHNAGISAECVALYEDARDGVVLPSTALDFLPAGIAAKPLYAFLGPLIDRAMTPDTGSNEVAVDPLVQPLLLDFQEAEAVNAYLNMLVHPVVGTRRSLDYALQLLEVGPYITEWWQPNVQSRFDEEAPVGPSDKAFHFTVTFPDGSLPKKAFDYRALIRMLFALKNERSRLISVRMADCVDIITLDNDCELDKYWLDSLEGFVDAETGVVICLHEDFTQHIDASEHVTGSLLTTWRTETTHAFCNSLLDFTNLDDDTIMDGGSFGAATFRTSQRALRGIVALRNVNFETGLYTKPQGRTTSTVMVAGGASIASHPHVGRTRDSVHVKALNLVPTASQTISLRLTSQRVAPESFYAQRAWNDQPDGTPRAWSRPGLTWLSSQPQAFSHRTSETLPNWTFGTGGGAVPGLGAAGVLFYGVIGSGAAGLRALGAAGAVKVAPAGPVAATLRRPGLAAGAKVGARAAGTLQLLRPVASGSGRMQPQAFGLLSMPLPVVAGQGAHLPPSSGSGGGLLQPQGSGGPTMPRPAARGQGTYTAAASASPVVRNSATTAAPVTLLAVRTQPAPAVSAPAAGESAEGTTLTAADGMTTAPGSIVTYDGTVITLQNSGAGTEVYANGVNMHMVEGNYGASHYPFPTTQLKWHNHRLCIRTTQKGFDDWSLCYGSSSPGVWSTCYINGEDPAVTDTYVVPAAYAGAQPYPLGSRVGNPDQGGYNDGMSQTTSMLGPIQLINVFNAFNQEWNTWAQAASSICGIAKSNPVSAGLMPVIGIKMARNYCGYYTNNLGDPSGHDNNKEFKDIIAGVHDADITAVADVWHSAYPEAYWRIAYEMNGGFMPDFIGGQNGDTATLPLWIGAFQRMATLIRASAAKKGVKAHIVWNPNCAQYSDTPVENAWPGDAYVDVIGLDQYSPVYNNATGGSGLYDWSKNDGSVCADNPTWVKIPENRITCWDYGSGDQYAKGSGLGSANQFGMQYALNFIKGKGKPMLMCETGAGNTHADGGTDPFRGPVDDRAFPLWLRSRLDQAANMGIPVLGVLIWCANESDGGWGFLGVERRRQAQAWSAAFGGTTAAALASF